LDILDTRDGFDSRAPQLQNGNYIDECHAFVYTFNLNRHF